MPVVRAPKKPGKPYRRRKGYRGGTTSRVAQHRHWLLDREFDGRLARKD